jgi:hypothetical protein
VITDTPTIEAALAKIEQDLTALGPIGAVLQTGDAMEVYVAKRSTLWNRRQTIQASMKTLAEVEPRLPPYEKWVKDLSEIRDQLLAELATLPPRITTEKDLYFMTDRRDSVKIIDLGRDATAMWGRTGRDVETLRVGVLLKERGYRQEPPVKNTNQVHGEIEWYGGLPESQLRLKELRAQRDQAQRDLDRALADA